MLNLTAHINAVEFTQTVCITLLMRYVFNILCTGYLCKALFHGMILQTSQAYNLTHA